MKWIDRYHRSVARAGESVAPRRADGNTAAFAAKVTPDDPSYAARVAKPVMAAVDRMPAEWRGLVHEYGYVDVYRAWKRGMSRSAVCAKAEANRGVFSL